MADRAREHPAKQWQGASKSSFLCGSTNLSRGRHVQAHACKGDMPTFSMRGSPTFFYVPKRVCSKKYMKDLKSEILIKQRFVHVKIL